VQGAVASQDEGDDETVKDFGTFSFQESVARALWTLAGHGPIRRAMVKITVILIRITCPAL